jgi:hypothetical protein
MADAVPMGREFQAVLDRLESDPPARREVAPESPKPKSAQVIQLPLWAENKRGTPNSFLRSSLFAAVQGKHRCQFKEEVLASQNGITIKYTGEQLNQSDLNVWEALINLGREQPLGNACSFSTHGLLKSLGLNTGRGDYKWFHSVIVRLTGAVVEIIHDGKAYGGTLVQEWAKDEAKGHYKIIMNKKLINLYGPAQWTAIDWSQRQKLRKQPLAQALHAFYSSHEKPYPLKIETLKKITGSRNPQMASFKRQAKLALTVLESIGFLKSFAFQNDLVMVTRVPD